MATRYDLLQELPTALLFRVTIRALSNMSLGPGARIGPYEVVAALGAGGMGEVYRARDAKLNRDVALKILPHDVALDPDRRARFTREAQLLASLNHPNIAAIYGFEDSGDTHALVLELVEGETLADRIARGPIPLDEALPIARQICEALEAAHEHGIIHRDLKPANIKVRSDGTVKVLDFGLAKLNESTGSTQPAAGSASLSPTLTSPALMTGVGVLLGTAAYMAPEQARGKVVDKRADIWAFGCVLFEMLASARPFAGDEVTDVIIAALSKEPDWTKLPASTLPRVRELLERCLRKDPRERVRDIGDVRLELSEARVSRAGSETIATHPSRTWRMAFGWALGGAIAGLSIAGAVWLILRSGPPQDRAAHLALNVPPDVELIARDKQGLSLSPDGRHLVFPGRRNGVSQLYERAFDRIDVVPIAGTEGAALPFFSPDGRWVGFLAGGKLRKVLITGGTVVPICDVVTDFHGAIWAPDDTILFGAGGLFRVAAAGGSPERITTPDPNRNETDHDSPDLLPGGEAVLLNVWTDGYAHPKIAVHSLATGQRRILLDGIRPRFVASGHIVYFRAGSIWAVPFDPARLQLTGAPSPVVQGVHADWAVWPYFTVSTSGTLAYVPGAPLDAKRLVWVDRAGAITPANTPAKTYDNPVLSPSGQRIAVVVREDDHDVWTLEPDRGTSTRVTSERGENESPVWTADGKRVVFAANKATGSALLSAAADGSDMKELMKTNTGHRHVDSMSADGQFLAFEDIREGTGSDIWILPMNGDRKPRAFLQTKFSESGAKFSPDGRWIAYTADDSGRSEVYVRPYPGPGDKLQVSTEGGSEPVWARSGRELFVRNGRKMLATEITTRPRLQAGATRVLFEGTFDNLPWNANYDVSADGERFLMIQPAVPDLATRVDVVINWLDELKRIVPTK